MNDKEAIKRLKEVIEDCTSGEDEPYKEAFGMAILALEKQLSSGWIPVSERLPKEDEEVLVTTIGNQVCWAFRYLDEWNTCLSTFENNDVLAWQPLPEPFKEVEDE